MFFGKYISEFLFLFQKTLHKKRDHDSRNNINWKKPNLATLIHNTNQLLKEAWCNASCDWLPVFSTTNRRAAIIDRYHPNAGAHSADIQGVASSFVTDHSNIPSVRSYALVTELSGKNHSHIHGKWYKTLSCKIFRQNNLSFVYLSKCPKKNYSLFFKISWNQCPWSWINKIIGEKGAFTA